MEREQLNQTLQELKQHLQAGGPLDSETQQLLGELSSQISSLVEGSRESAGTAALPADDKETLLDRVLSLTDEFEESHPQLAEALGNVASALSRIGI